MFLHLSGLGWMRTSRFEANLDMSQITPSSSCIMFMRLRLHLGSGASDGGGEGDLLSLIHI